jgi:hypothetical protein
VASGDCPNAAVENIENKQTIKAAVRIISSLMKFIMREISGCVSKHPRPEARGGDRTEFKDPRINDYSPEYQALSADKGAVVLRVCGLRGSQKSPDLLQAQPLAVAPADDQS